MDALFGWMGPRDDASWHRMRCQLSHRGALRERDCVAEQAVSMGRVGLDRDEVVGIRVGPRRYADDRVAMVLCGYVTRWNGVASDQLDALSQLAAFYRCDGVHGFKVLRGAYVVALYDFQNRSLHLIRDGAGVRTLFYASRREDWVFASEPKAITSSPGFVPRIRHAAIAQYLSFSFVPGQGTMLEDVYEVPCGHAVSLRGDATPMLTNLFPFEEEEPAAEESGDIHADSERSWIDKTRETIASAVADRLPRGEPVGIFLSGGLDSSIIAAEVARQHDHDVSTYAIHFGAGYPNELSFAASVAKHCGTRHHEILVRPSEFASRMRKMVWHLDEPIGDPITQPNYELAARVAQDVRWVFNGEGGDPLFGGPKNLPMMLQHWYGVPREGNFRERAYLASYRRAYEECERLLHPNVRAQLDWRHDLESILTPFFESDRPRSFLNKLMAINIRLKGAHLILPKVERMLAAAGLTPLSPLFDEQLIRLSFQMPPNLKLRHGTEKWVLKEAYRDALPPEVIDRPKSGMRVPVHHWFRGEMSRLAKRTLTTKSLRESGLFDSDRVRQLLRYDIDEGAGRYGIRLWMLLTFEIWRRLVVIRDGD